MFSFVHFTSLIYSISQEICTRFCCALLCCGYAIVHNEFTFIHIHQAYFTGTGAIVRLPQCQWSKPDGYGKISQCITTTKHSKAKTVCIFLGIYCSVCCRNTHFVEDTDRLMLHNQYCGWWWPRKELRCQHRGTDHWPGHTRIFSFGSKKSDDDTLPKQEFFFFKLTV